MQEEEDNFRWYDPRLVTVLVVFGLFALSGVGTGLYALLILAVASVVGFLLIGFSISKTEADAAKQGRRIEW